MYKAYVIDGGSIEEKDATLYKTDAEGEYLKIEDLKKDVIVGSKLSRLYNHAGQRVIFVHKSQVLALEPIKLDSEDYPSAALVHRFLCEEHAENWAKYETEHVEGNQWFKRNGKWVLLAIGIFILIVVLANAFGGGTADAV